MNTILEVKDLKKHFKTPNGTLHAVDGISFKIDEGQTLGIVGESGCGKSTLGRTILQLLQPTSGQIFFEQKDITNISKADLKKTRRNMQMIFQDPFSSLNPRMTVSEIISEPMRIHNMYKGKKELERTVIGHMQTVGLAKRLQNSYPHELDGGRRQRIGVARAIALEPKFIVCDEPVSALDVSIQAQILNLMMDLQDEKNLTYIFITHDLSVIKHISDDVGVMYLGKILEKCSSELLFEKNYHPYTKALLSAIPTINIDVPKKRILLKGEISSPINPKPGCRFAPRCMYSKPKCFNVEPGLFEVEQNHLVACHFVREINKF